MIKLDDEHLLFIEPSKPISPIINDELTEIISEAWKYRETSRKRYRGHHLCSCGAVSDNTDHWVTINGIRYLTNSLAVHYVRSHRDEIPDSEIAKLL